MDKYRTSEAEIMRGNIRLGNENRHWEIVFLA